MHDFTATELAALSRPGRYRELHANGSTAARALEFCILTATRTSETLLAKRNEIDREAGVWTLPSGRMKNQKIFRVPLSPAVIKLTDGAAREGDGTAYIFPGTREGRALGSTSMLELMRRLRPDFTVHGFRSSFRDWAGESGYPRELAELALAHTLKDATERAYARSDMLEQRRAMMAAWANHCCGTTPPREPTFAEVAREGLAQIGWVPGLGQRAGKRRR